MIKLTFGTLLIFGFLSACSEPEVTILPSPAETPNVISKPPLELVDISKMPPLSAKRMQSFPTDALGNKNQILEDLVANGKDSIPFLINQLEDETEMERTTMRMWYQLYIGDMALIILNDLFTDEAGMKSTIPGFGWDEFLERGNEKHMMGEEVLRRYIRKHGRKMIRQRWQKMWIENKENIYWDPACRCFHIRNLSK